MTSRFALVLTIILTLSSSAVAADATAGRRTFVENGCFACHDYNGQGAITGPKLAPNPIDLDSMGSFIRHCESTNMPVYSKHVLSDASLADIHAWLVSQPETRSSKGISLLSH